MNPKTRPFTRPAPLQS